MSARPPNAGEAEKAGDDRHRRNQRPLEYRGSGNLWPRRWRPHQFTWPNGGCAPIEPTGRKNVSSVPDWALLIRGSGGTWPGQPGREVRMTSISTVGHAEVGAVPKAKTESFARPRPHLPDAGGAAAPRRHPLYLFRSHRSEVILRLRHDRARHRQLLHGDVLLPVGTVRLVRYRPQGTADYLQDRLLRLALPFAICAFTVDSARLLRHLPAAPSRGRLFGILVEYGHEGSVAERADRVLLGPVRLRPGCLRCCTGCRPICSIRSTASRCTAAAGPRCSSRSCLPSPRRSTFPGWFTTGQPVGSSSGRSRSSTGA